MYYYQNWKKTSTIIFEISLDTGVYLHFLYNYNLHNLGGNPIARTFSGLSFHSSSVKLKLSRKKADGKKQSAMNIQTSDNDFPKL